MFEPKVDAGYINFVYLYFDGKLDPKLMPKECIGDGKLAEVMGVFNIKRNSKSTVDFYYITEIEKIYNFDDTRSFENGGGAKIECYSQK